MYYISVTDPNNPNNPVFAVIQYNKFKDIESKLHEVIEEEYGESPIKIKGLEEYRLTRGQFTITVITETYEIELDLQKTWLY